VFFVADVKVARDSSGEFIRCALMVGICMMHSCVYSAYPCVWWANIFYTFLDGFVILSGWYGIRFTWKKFVSLWGIAFVCAAVNSIWYYGFVRHEGVAAINHILPEMFCHWYLNAYAVLMLLAPMVNLSILQVIEKKCYGALISFFALCFGWSWLVEKGARFFTLPMSAGLGSSSFLTLLGVYVVGRICRSFELDKKLSFTQSFGIWMFGVVMCIAGLGWYASPFTVFGAIGLFLFLKKPRYRHGLVRLHDSLGHQRFPFIFSMNVKRGIGLSRN